MPKDQKSKKETKKIELAQKQEEKQKKRTEKEQARQAERNKLAAEFAGKEKKYSEVVMLKYADLLEKQEKFLQKSQDQILAKNKEIAALETNNTDKVHIAKLRVEKEQIQKNIDHVSDLFKRLSAYKETGDRYRQEAIEIMKGTAEIIAQKYGKRFAGAKRDDLESAHHLKNPVVKKQTLALRKVEYSRESSKLRGLHEKGYFDRSIDYSYSDIAIDRAHLGADVIKKASKADMKFTELADNLEAKLSADQSTEVTTLAAIKTTKKSTDVDAMKNFYVPLRDAMLQPDLEESERKFNQSKKALDALFNPSQPTQDVSVNSGTEQKKTSVKLTDDQKEAIYQQKKKAIKKFKKVMEVAFTKELAIKYHQTQALGEKPDWFDSDIILKGIKEKYDIKSLKPTVGEKLGHIKRVIKGAFKGKKGKDDVAPLR